MTDSMPHTCRPLHPAEPFQFQCYPGVTCFTDCCRELDLALTPYDTLRLKNRLKMHSGHFLEQYVIVEWDERQPFPLCYLTMVDDGRASCVFVREDGCSVYSDRPGSCRAYPVGRGTTRQPDGKILEQFILLTEAHCKGFAENNEQDIAGYFTNQEMTAYNRANDALLPLLQHERIQRGFKPSREQLDQYMLALYNLDTFRQEIADGRITLHRPFNPLEMQGIAGDDEHLLQLGITWLIQEFFQN